MIGRVSTLLLALTLVAGCGGSPKPAPVAPAALQAPTAAAPAAAAEKPVAAEWSYTSVGKRDPFRSFLTELENTGQAGPNRCPTPLGRFEIEQLRLVAVITGLDDPVAMVQAPTGVGYSIRRGVCIGKNGGTVAAVRSGEVVVSEWAVRADGSRDRTQTIMKLPKQPSLTQE